MIPPSGLSLRTILLVTLLTLITVPRATAQITIACPSVSATTTTGTTTTTTTTNTTLDADTCVVPIPTATPQAQVLRFRINPVGAAVRFHASSGTMVPDSTAVHSDGIAETVWTHAKGADTAQIVVEVLHEKATALRIVRMIPAQTSTYVLLNHSGNNQTWFEKQTLRFPIVVRVASASARTADTDTPDTSSVLCRSMRVVFTRRGAGTVAPDTVIPQVVPSGLRSEGNRTRCLAFANRALGDGAGERWTYAELLGPRAAPGLNPIAFRSYARSLPRLVTGLGVTWNRGYWAVKADSDRAGKVERILPDGTKVTKDTVFEGRKTAHHLPNSWDPAAFAGINTPLYLKARWLSATVGVDPKSPDKSWYTGVSLLNLFPGRALNNEALPIGLHALLHRERPEVLDDHAACEASGACDTHRPILMRGFTVVLTVDASTVITDIIKTLGGG